ncbi:tRNA (adenine(58)-N(1))-methyltransferase non-catalytic subunit trm6 [Dispira parvispora]|uniref:tRNA (adenine(58)-N(1))-methyltransferase non-catalytic subunit TRM6 n=1 Tax=Dispira parvispora TaxID=1520584 RepID=A0A9W8AXQ9_9FUNG|nr:tRNA (adenine(58)-N(1))-methyltransferase non-catalytic subunit trm6 [Dispira parvispora]
MATNTVPQEGHLVRAHQFVLIQLTSGNYKTVQLKPGSTVELGKFGAFQTDDIIGKPFGVTYEVYEKKRIRPYRAADLSAVEETEATNRDILDDPNGQKLSHQEIEQLKQSSIEGEVNHEQLVEKVVENNKHFEKKTEFSKAKYIQRKKKKFFKLFTVVEPTLYNVCDYFFQKNPTKTRDIRVDTLSQMVTYANISAYSRTLVVDDTHGLLLCAALTRSTVHSQVLALMEGDSPSFEILKLMNFPPETLDRLHYLSWNRMSKDEAAFFDERDTSKMDDKELRGHERRRKTYEKLLASQSLLAAGDFDALLIASQYDPVSILKELVPYVGGSRPIVVYSPSKEPLIMAAAYMKTSPDFINPQITESWMREYQVLPGRTHPLMVMSAGGGFLLTAIRVYDSPEAVPIFSTPRLAPCRPSRTGRLPPPRKIAEKSTSSPSAKVPSESENSTSAMTMETEESK